MSGEQQPGHQGDYLWDRSGPVDAEILALERALSVWALPADAAGATPAHPIGERLQAGRQRARPGATIAVRRRRFRQALAALAAMLLLCVGVAGWYQHRLLWPDAQPWRISQVRGQIRVDDAAVATLPALAPGQVLETASGASVRMRAARIGEVVIGERSRFRIVQTASGRHRTQLQQGSLWARIWAPPGAFAVAAPMGDVYDMGCEFLLRAYADGSGSLTVRSGWVQLDNGWREVMVPQGARVEMRADGQPGTPYDLRSSPAFRSALQRLDADESGMQADSALVGELVAASRPHDALSLLSLLQSRPQLVDGPIFDRVSALMPTDARVTRAQVRQRGAQAYDAWWHALPYPRMKRWWLHWPDVVDAGEDAGDLLSETPR